MEQRQDDRALLEAFVKHYSSLGYKTARSETASGLEVITAKKPAHNLKHTELFDLSVLAADGMIVGIRTLRNYSSIVNSKRNTIFYDALVAGENPLLYSCCIVDDKGTMVDRPSVTVCVVNDYDKLGLLNSSEGNISLFRQLSIFQKGEKFLVEYNNHFEMLDKKYDYALWFVTREGFSGSYTGRWNIIDNDNIINLLFTGTVNPSVGMVDDNGKVLLRIPDSNGEIGQLMVFPSVIYKPTLEGIDVLMHSDSDWIRLPRDYPIVEFRPEDVNSRGQWLA